MGRSIFWKFLRKLRGGQISGSHSCGWERKLSLFPLLISSRAHLKNCAAINKEKDFENSPPKVGVNLPKGGTVFLCSVWNIRVDIGHLSRVVLVVKEGGQKDAEKEINHQRQRVQTY